VSPATTGTTVALYDAANRRGTKAMAAAQNARGMVLNRDPRFMDLAALVTQLVGQVQATQALASETNTSAADLAKSLADAKTVLGTVAAGLASNTAGDQATRTTMQGIAADVLAGKAADAQLVQQLQQNAAADAAQGATIDQLHESLVTATAQLAASDAEMAARMAKAEQALRDEATVRAAADAAEAKTRADGLAAEARTRADADTSNAALAAAATKAEADARTAAVASEAATRAAADTALAARATALENYMPAVTSGRASTGNLLMVAGSTRDVVVTFDTAATDATYTPVAVLDVPDQANYTVVGITNRTKTGCTVTVRNRALVSLTAVIGVTVLALKL
jgi:hypothetical protein